MSAFRHLKDLPGPTGIPFLGSLFQLTPKKVYVSLEAWADRYGPVYRLKVPGKNVLVIADAEWNQKILKERPHDFSRMYKMEPVAREIGVNGVYFAEGRDWKRQRHFANQALSKKQVDLFFPVLKECVQNLRSHWLIQTERGNPIDIKKDFMRFTVDTTTRMAFGYNMNTLETGTDEIQEHLLHIFPMLRRRIFWPVRYWRWFRLPADRRLDRSLKEIKRVVRSYIDRGRSQLAEDPVLAANPSNFLEALLVANAEDGSFFTEEEIFTNVFTMLLAGEDTTATSLTWMLYFLAEHPEVHLRIVSEVDQVLDATGDHRRPTSTSAVALYRGSRPRSDAAQTGSTCPFCGCSSGDGDRRCPRAKRDAFISVDPVSLPAKKTF